jgi:hypothetical protein
MLLNPLEQTIAEFIATREKPFKLDQLYDYIIEKKAVSGRISHERLVRVLNQSGLILSRDDKTFHPRCNYFKKAKFLIYPLQQEINNGILIPGHRLVPFYNPELLPCECSLLFSGEFRVEQKKIKKKFEDLLIYYSLFGSANLFMVLGEDEEKNLKVFEKGDSQTKVEITVFDMKGLYRDLEFSYGDYFLAEAEDWDEGIFSLEYLPASKMAKDSREVEKWIEMLENGFFKTFDRLGPIPDLAEVIAHAFFFAGQEVIENPRLHLGGFLNRSGRVEITAAGLNTYLWKKSESVEEAMCLPSDLSGPMGDTDSLEAVISDIGLSLNISEIGAYMRDELFSRGNSLDRVVERILKGREVLFYDEIQKEAFFKYMKELWEAVKKNYNIFSDSMGGKLRSKALKVLDEPLRWLRDLDARGMEPDELPSDRIVTIGQFMTALSALINTLNYPENISKEEYVKTDQLLEEIARSVHSLIEEVNDMLFKT